MTFLPGTKSNLPEIDFKYKPDERQGGPEEEKTGFTDIKLARTRHQRQGELTEVCHLFINMNITSEE
jgi:hypothetical protein